MISPAGVTTATRMFVPPRSTPRTAGPLIYASRTA